MRKTAKLGMVVAAGAFAIAVPAAAQPSHPSHPSHPSSSRKCAAHKVGYIAHGTIATDGWNATDNGDGTWTGSVDVNVKQANHHAKGAGTFNLLNTKVRLGDGVSNPPVAGDRVFVIGKITKVAKKCTDQSAAGVVTLRRVNVLAPPTS